MLVASRGDTGRKPSLSLDELFDAQDSRFLEVLREFHDPQALATFADRWKLDLRPWARQQILDYLQLPLDSPGHQPVVKRLFKQAESRGDSELVAAFLVAFDRLVRRVIRRRSRYDWQTRTVSVEESLTSPRNTLVGDSPQRPSSGGKPPQIWPGARLFSYHTRYYLRRRAWRYFRHLGYRQPDAYVQAAAGVLARYRDEDLAAGENLLDSWGLMQICFREHDALSFQATAILLKEGRGLAELTPAPRFPESWKRPEAARVLLDLVVRSSARLVRFWSMQLLRRHHLEQLAASAPDSFITLLDHDDDEVQRFGAELLASSRELPKLPIENWLRLIQTRNSEALATICEAMRRHVAAERLELAQCVALACARPTPVARMGFHFLRSRPPLTAEARDAVSAVAGARCAAVAGEMTAWCLGHFGSSATYDCELVSRFFDASLPETRRAAWSWLVAGSPGFEDPSLWSRLVETPHDDLRLPLVDLLQKRATLPDCTHDDLVPVWSSVLLGVHRGGRQKGKAVHQVARAVAADPALADALLPVLAVAVRSVRGPEMRAALAATVAAVTARPELAAATQRYLPELEILPGGATQ
jgi:hypothetical protein